MKKFRIVEMETGKFKVEYFETSFFENPRRQWSSWQFTGSDTLKEAQEIYDQEIKDRDNRLMRHKVKRIIKSEIPT